MQPACTSHSRCRNSLDQRVRYDFPVDVYAQRQCHEEDTKQIQHQRRVDQHQAPGEEEDLLCVSRESHRSRLCEPIVRIVIRHRAQMGHSFNLLGLHTCPQV